MEKAFLKGQVVKGKVYRIIPHFGILVRLEDGTRGFIRRRELSWSEVEPDPRDYAQVGDEIEAVVLERDPETGSLSLSLRLLERDPWQDIEQRYPVGKEVEGIVTEILPDYGAFVEIEPGLKGLVHISQIDPDRWIENVEEALWVGDHVKALVVKVDPEARHIHLSIKAYVRKKRQEREAATQPSPEGAPLKELLDKETELLLQKVMGELPHPEEFPEEAPLGPGLVRHILIVDDHPGFRKPLVEWLKRRGYEVQEALSGDEGISLAREGKYDLIFLDLYLPDTNGFQVAEEIADIQPGAQIVLVTGYEVTDQEVARAAKLGLPLRLKPLDEQDLREMLLALERGEPLPVESPPEAPVEEPEFLRRGVEALTLHAPLPQILEAILEGLSRETGARSLALFSLNPVKQEISLEAGKRVPALSEEHRHTLVYSPVNDVIRRGGVIYEKDVPRPRFRYLLKWLPFRSCIGVPVPVLGKAMPYALFLFHPTPHRFSSTHLLRARTASSLIGAALAFEEAEVHLRRVQQLILKGQLGAGLLHEVRNRFDGVLLTAQNLQEELKALEGKGDKLSKALTQAKEYADEVRRNIREVLRSIRLFDRLSRAEVWEEVNVNYSVRRAADLLRPMAEKNKVEIEMELDRNLPPTRSIGVRLDQVFYNVLLNAIEWTAHQPGARVTISTSFEPDGERPIKVRFRDTGPGIHRQLFERIYELGFTTREGGTGLGLFIAKALVESVGGRIFVEESTILVGTTFLVELPLIPIREGENERHKDTVGG